MVRSSVYITRLSELVNHSIFSDFFDASVEKKPILYSFTYHLHHFTDDWSFKNVLTVILMYYFT